MKKNKTVLRMDQNYVVIPYQNPLAPAPAPVSSSFRPILPKPDPKGIHILTEELALLQSDLGMGVEHLEVYVAEAVDTITPIDDVTPTAIVTVPKEDDDDPIESTIDIITKQEDDKPLESTMCDPLAERCRMCAEKREKLQLIFSPGGRQQELAQKMSKFLYIYVREDDHLPLSLCEECILKLQASHDLAQSCAHAQTKLSSMWTCLSFVSCGQTYTAISPKSPMTNPCNNFSDHEDTTSNAVQPPPYVESNLSDVVKPQPAINVQPESTESTILPKRRKTSASPLRCSRCLVSFSSYEELSSHILEHEQHSCTSCTSVFKSEKELNNHLETHKTQADVDSSNNSQNSSSSSKRPQRVRYDAPRRYLAPSRRRKAKEPKIPMKYSETKDGKKNYECGICSKVFHIRCRFVTHIQRHTGQRKKECQVCHKWFFNNDDLRNHMTTHNKSLKFICDLCNRVFHCKRYLNVHFQKVHNKEWYYKCKLCEERFPSVSEIENHIEINHKNVFSNMEDRFYIKMSDYQCHICQKFSSNRYNLHDHLKMHKRDGTDVVNFNPNKEKQFQCEKCAKMFASKTSLTVHLQIHAGDKPLQCQYCPKRFLYKQSLDQHEMIHVGNRPYKCKTCTKSYVHISALKTHVKKVHLNLRPFICEYCNKGFPRRGNLNVHLRIHTGVRPFRCRYCERDFTQKQEMQRHELTHTNATLYRCSKKCGYGCNRRKHLAEHEAICTFICNPIEEHQSTDGEIHHFLILH